MGEKDVAELKFSAKTKAAAVRTSAVRTREPAVKKTAQKSAGSALTAVLALMVCCAVLLSVTLSDPPAAAVFAGGESSVTTAEDVLGRLKFLGKELISVFSREEELALPVNGSVSQSYHAEDGTVEFLGESGCDVYAAADGVVTDVTTDETGCTVTIDHGDGKTTQYALLGTAVVEAGQPVKQGDALATAPSGRVRFSYAVNGVPQDPSDSLGISVR